MSVARGYGKLSGAQSFGIKSISTAVGLERAHNFDVTASPGGLLHP
jgi:hypothetical protein